MQILSIINQKGGTGKTTTTINLGVALSKKGKKVLLIDLDPQGHLSFSLGVHQENYTLVDLLSKEATFQQVCVEKHGLAILPSHQSLTDIEIQLLSFPQREKQLWNCIENHISTYDYVLIDCPPSLSILTVNALFFTQKVIVPMQLEVLSVYGLEQIIQTIEKIKKALNPALCLYGVLPIMVDYRKNISKEILEHIQEEYAIDVFPIGIRNSVKVSEAPSFGLSVIDYAPECTSAQDYLLVADELLK